MTTHPLDPLTRDEIARARDIVRRDGGLSAAAWFETIALHEPDRQALAAGSAGREAFICCYDPASGATWDGVADLDAGRLLRWAEVQGMHARIVADEFAAGGEAAKKDPRFIEACARRGITDMESVLVEAWAAGYFGIPEEEGQRIAYGHCWVRNASGDNPYARPIANLHPVIDLRRMEVIRVDDFGVVPVPPDSSDIIQAATRHDLKPLEITQPEGPSFTGDGHEVRWQNWRGRIGFHVRDG